LAISARVRGRSGAVRPQPIGTVARDASPAAEAARGILEGVRVLLANGEIRLIVLLLGLRAVVSGAMDVLFVLLALEVFHTGDPGAALLNGSLGIGMVLGGTVSFVLIGRRRLAPALGVAACVLGASLTAAAAFGSAVNAPFLILLGGIGYASADVAGRTILQRTADDAVLGRVLGTLESIGLFGLAIGSLLAPAIALVAGTESALVAAGLILPIGILLGWRGLRRIDDRTRVPERELELLRRSPVFAPLPPPALETVARHVRWLAVDPGTAVIVEGERGDAYYVIERGRFRVEEGGIPRRVLDQAVDGFGEIALLRDSPRTATVIAEEPSVLLVISRDTFLGAVMGSPPARTVAEGIAEGRR
jgi:hypothetical protein